MDAKCYYLKNSIKVADTILWWKMGERAAGKKLKVEGMNSNDRFIQNHLCSSWGMH